MNFLACDGDWSVSTGSISCDGTLITITGQEIAAEVTASSALSIEEAKLLVDSTLSVFVVVFLFLAMKKLL